MPSFAQRLAAWARLLRLPNQFTVPGDVFAGLVWSGGTLSGAYWAIPAVILLYSGGLLLNDFFDQKVDRKERPDRPIPSGTVSAAAVLIAGCVMLASGVTLSFLAGNIPAGEAAAIIAGLVLLYDSLLKSVKWVGPLAMGLCRGGAVAIGGLAGTGALNIPVLAVIGFAVAYTSVVTMVAADEMSIESPGFKAYLPMLVIMAGGIVGVWLGPPDVLILAGNALFVLAMVQARTLAVRVNAGKIAVPDFIGNLLRLMIVIQAAWVVTAFSALGTTHVLVAIGVFAALAVGARVAAFKYYGS